MTHTAPTPSVPPNPPSAGAILFVDDEPYIRDLGAMVLRRHGYEVLPAESGARAVEVYRREGRRVALVVLDLTMPGLSGEEALKQLVDLDPGVRVLLSSGQPGAGAHLLGYPQVCGIMPKPYLAADLLRTVRVARGES